MQEVFLTMMYERILIPSSDGYELPLDVYCPHVSVEIDPDIQRPAVVICPGGGYAWLSEREGEPIALAFTALGFNAFVVWYRVAPNRYPRPQQDVASAVAWVRAHAAETHTDPNRIAVMGFSAGGHCAGSLGVWWPKAELWAEMGLTPEQVKPNAMVLCYPVISGGPKAHCGSFECLTGSKDMFAGYVRDGADSAHFPVAHVDGHLCARGEHAPDGGCSSCAQRARRRSHFPAGRARREPCLPHHLRRQVPRPQSPRLRRMAPNGRRVLGENDVRYSGEGRFSKEKRLPRAPSRRAAGVRVG